MSADSPDLVGVRLFQIRQTKPPILFGIDKLFLTIFCLEATWIRRFLSGKGPFNLLYVSSHLEGAVQEIWINTNIHSKVTVTASKSFRKFSVSKQGEPIRM